MRNINPKFENIMKPPFGAPWTRRTARRRARFGTVATVFLTLFLLCSVLPQAAQADYQQLDMAADVKSRFSTGCSSIQELMTQAEFKGLDGLLFGDHDRQTLQYGLPYLERVLKIKIGRPALLENGAADFLNEINQIDRSDDSMVLVPGVESAPFYYWTGNPLEQSLVAHNWDKHLLIVGLPDLAAYEGIPILNGPLSYRQWKDDYLLFSLLCAAVLIGLVASMIKRWRYRGTSFILTVVMSLLAANAHPFLSSPFDQYQGDLGVKPYQYLIDYVDSRGGLVFWNHLETPVMKKIDGGPMQVTVRTEPHPQDLLLTRHYTGFQAVSETPVSSVEPGNEWDQVLMQYLSGQRDRPVWGYGANDFHCEGQGGGRLGWVRTVVLVEQADQTAVMEAMRAGRMYAVKQKDDKNRLSLDTFALIDSSTGKRAVQGENLNTKKPPDIALKLSMKDGSDALVTLKLIRNGEVIKKAVIRLPYDDVWQDLDGDRLQPTYYRLLAETDADNRLVSNPVFLNSGASGKAVVASAEVDPTPVLPVRKNFTPLPPKRPQESAPQIQAQKPEELKPQAQAQKPEELKPQAQAQWQIDSAPQEKPPVTEPVQKYVEVTATSVRLRKGPGITFPVSGKVSRGDRLLFVRRTEVIYKGRAWIVIQNKGELAYVWEGLVKEAQPI